MSVGDRILLARKANQLSQRALGEKVNVSAMAISKYERNLDMPSSGVLVRLARELDVSISFFFQPNTPEVNIQAFRKHTSLKVKEQNKIQARISDWLTRYIEVEELFLRDHGPAQPPQFSVRSFEDIENAAMNLRKEWNLGMDPIDNLTQLLEDKGFKIGFVQGFDHFDACTFIANGHPVIIVKDGIPGDRQRFDLGHELGHLVLEINGGLNEEKACNRFVGAFLVPKDAAFYELTPHRSNLGIHELLLLKEKYGFSMQAWIYRACDLGIISESMKTTLFKQFSQNGWRKKEPGKSLPSETSTRMEKLIYQGLSEDQISRSKAQELLGKPITYNWLPEVV